LAEVCLLQQPTMTKLLDRMVRDGLVTRSQDARDRRVVRVALTPQGETLAAELITAARQHESNILARFPEMEAMDLRTMLRSVSGARNQAAARRLTAPGARAPRGLGGPVARAWRAFVNRRGRA
jgi:DNA-binding MarR family transcriptional regulator